MALASPRGIVRRRRRAQNRGFRTHRTVTAAASPLNLNDRQEAKRLRSLRQGWQEEAWTYRDNIGELRYAQRFLANSARRMRLFPAVYVNGTYDEDPERLTKVVAGVEQPLEGVPPEVVAACDDAMSDLGTGRLAISQIMHDISANFSIAGEAFIVGRTDPADGSDSWRIRSIDEVRVIHDTYQFRDEPMDASGQQGWDDATPGLDYVARIWTPHPRFQALADSPMQAILSLCEEMLILERDVRATGRSRLAGAGAVTVPEGLSITGYTQDNNDPESDPFLGALTEAMVTPIGDEGTASAVVPILIRGKSEDLAQFRHVTFDRPMSATYAAERSEILGRMATSIDLPKEILMGMADLNHWTAWQVDDNTFRHHVEPHVQECVDALTVGYFRSALMADSRMQGANSGWISKLCVWYDPVDLVTHPDRSTDAINLYDRKEISGKALREATGFEETDAPEPLELGLRMVANTRTLPANLLIALYHNLDPNLRIPAITGAGLIPGITAEGVVAPPPVLPPSAPGPELPPDGTGSPPPPPNGPAGGPPPTPGATPTPPKPANGPPATTASAGTIDYAGLSRRLVDIDRELRSKLVVAANHSMARILERAGNRLRSKVTAARDETLRQSIDQVPARLVASTLGRPVVAAMNVPDLTGTDWSDLHNSYTDWVSAANDNAAKTAARMAGLPLHDPAVVATRQALDDNAATAWPQFSQALSDRTSQLLYDPDPNVGPADLAEGLDQASDNSLCPTGLVRSVLNVIGGGQSTMDDWSGNSYATVSGDPMTQLGSGDVVSGLLADNDLTADQYQWIHGFATNPFEPHADLDGTTFSGFDDDVLANDGDFPDAAYFLPGDHMGCTCDYMTTWSPTDDESGVSTPGDSLDQDEEPEPDE